MDAALAYITDEREPIIEISNLTNKFGKNIVHENINLTIHRKEIVAIIGGSGCGKTTLLRTLLMLRKPNKGSIKIFGRDIANCTELEAQEVKARWGVMFQSCALFSALTVLENVIFPLKEHTNLPKNERESMALLKIALAGLEKEAALKFPSELSGGMKKRAALARAIALDPELVFLDEPTSGLDPKSASDLDDLILHWRDHLGLTFVIVTHDLETLSRVPDRIVFLGEGHVLADLPFSQLVFETHPLISNYFGGTRGMLRAIKGNNHGS